MKRETLGSSVLALLAVGIAANAILGPLVFGIIKLRISALTENQLLGGELVSLFVVAPVGLFAAFLWHRSHPAAPVLALGVSLYALYTYPQFIVGPQYDRYDGNNEYFFPLYLILVLLALAVAVIGWVTLGSMDLPMPSTKLRRVLSLLLFFVAFVLAAAWIRSIAAVLGRAPLIGQYEQDQALFWVFRLMDLGFVIPVGLVTAVGLMRKEPWSPRIAYAFVGVQTMLVAAVASMAVVMSIRNDPGYSALLASLTIALTIVFAGTFLRMLRALSHGGRWKNANLAQMAGDSAGS